MLFPYYFLDDKLDITKFSRPATHYIGTMREISFHLFLPHYKITVEIAGLDNSTAHIATVFFSDIRRDKDGSIVGREEAIFPLLDIRFKDNPDVGAIFTVLDNYRGSFTSSSAKETVDKLCNLIKLVFKLDHLKAFL